MKIKLKRAYVPPAASDGYRVLVDRLWPRGISKSQAKIDCWLKDIAPSSELRKWFGHDPAKWSEFKKRYVKELKTKKTDVAELRKLSRKESITLVYGAKDEEHNDAVVLASLLGRSRKPVSKKKSAS